MDKPDSLCVIWTSENAETALNMALMYAKNSRLYNWWETVRLIVWGPAQKTLAANGELQNELKACAEAGVELYACRACADRYGLAEILESFGVEVLYTGEPLTHMLKTGWSVLTV